jgi:transposase-like protein
VCRSGLTSPLLVITDGAPGLISAVEQVWPASLRQRRVKVIGRLPGERSCLSLVWAVLDRALRGWRRVELRLVSVRALQQFCRDLHGALGSSPAIGRTRGGQSAGHPGRVRSVPKSVPGHLLHRP